MVAGSRKQPSSKPVVTPRKPPAAPSQRDVLKQIVKEALAELLLEKGVLKGIVKEAVMQVQAQQQQMLQESGQRFAAREDAEPAPRYEKTEDQVAYEFAMNQRRASAQSAVRSTDMRRVRQEVMRATGGVDVFHDITPDRLAYHQGASEGTEPIYESSEFSELAGVEDVSINDVALLEQMYQ